MQVGVRSNTQELHAAALRLDAGDTRGAAEICRRALAEHQDEAQATHLMGLTLCAEGQSREALWYLRRAAVLDPKNAEVNNSLGAAYARLGQYRDAIECFARAIGLRQDFAAAHVNLAAALMSVGRREEAVSAATHGLELDCSLSLAHVVLASILQEQGHVSSALRAFRRAGRCGRESDKMLKECGLLLAEAGRVRTGIKCLARAVRVGPPNAKLHSSLLFTMHHDLACAAAVLTNEHRAWAIRYAEPLRARWRPHVNAPLPTRRLHVGYVSADFREHSVARFLEPLVEHRERREFHVTCYSDVDRPDEVTRRFQTYSDLWRNTKSLSDEDLAEVVRRDRIDILVDTTGHMPKNRALLFARKPAPLQVAFPGYPGTTGMVAMDAVITDSLQSPVQQKTEHFSERLVRIDPSARCYRVEGNEPDVSELPALANGGVTFGSFNRPVKVSEAIATIWSSLLNAIPSARLMMFLGRGVADAKPRFVRIFGRNGIAADRLTFLGQLPRDRYLRVYHQVDVALDTYPYNGCTTICDALWMGVPSICLTGETYVSRVGLSILSQVGLESLAVGSTAEYVETAMSLARDVPRLQNLRGCLREIMRRSPLCDGKRVAAAFGGGLRQLWVEWCAAARRAYSAPTAD
jgi:predicted O-linked N-acetylglucosamine transferase (SPINDLY family)